MRLCRRKHRSEFHPVYHVFAHAAGGIPNLMAPKTSAPSAPVAQSQNHQFSHAFLNVLTSICVSACAVSPLAYSIDFAASLTLRTATRPVLTFFLSGMALFLRTLSGFDPTKIERKANALAEETFGMAMFSEQVKRNLLTKRHTKHAMKRALLARVDSALDPLLSGGSSPRGSLSFAVTVLPHPITSQNRTARRPFQIASR